MTDPELDLTPEELALLAAEGDGVAPVAEADSTQVDDEPPAQEQEQDVKPKRRSRKRAQDDDEPVGDELPPVKEPTFPPEPEPDPVAEALAGAEDAIAELGERNERTAEALGIGPGPGHPHAPPAQMDYGDPWGELPTQMRHDNDGRPAF